MNKEQEQIIKWLVEFGKLLPSELLEPMENSTTHLVWPGNPISLASFWQPWA